MNKETMNNLQETVATFAVKNAQLDNKIQANISLFPDIFKQFKERAKVIDRNNSELLNYLNSIDSKDLIKFSQTVQVLKYFSNYTTFYGHTIFYINKNNEYTLSIKFQCPELREVNNNNDTAYFDNCQDFVSSCSQLLKMNFNYIEKINNLLNYYEQNFVTEVYNVIKNACENINQAKEQTLSNQSAILKAIGLEAPRKVNKYRITIEIID